METRFPKAINFMKNSVVKTLSGILGLFNGSARLKLNFVAVNNDRVNFVPEVHIDFSSLYNEAIRHGHYCNFSSARSRISKTSKLQDLWKKDGHKILEELERITKLNWKHKEITCYVADGVVPYSDPVTISNREDAATMLDTLTHELVHVILSEPKNWEKIKKNWDFLMEKYRDESELTREHIPVHAVHKALMLNLFGKERVAHEMGVVKHPSYKRSWEIVEKDGYQNIIKDLTKGLHYIPS